jgi:lipid A ethanolaminephosphotransferase
MLRAPSSSHWLSADYQKGFGIDEQCLRQQAQNEAVSQDNLFSTVLGMMNVQTSVYQSQMDLLDRCRRT